MGGPVSPGRVVLAGNLCRTRPVRCMASLCSDRRSTACRHSSWCRPPHEVDACPFSL